MAHQTVFKILNFMFRSRNTAAAIITVQAGTPMIRSDQEAHQMSRFPMSMQHAGHKHARVSILPLSEQRSYICTSLQSRVWPHFKVQYMSLKWDLLSPLWVTWWISDLIMSISLCKCQRPTHTSLRLFVHIQLSSTTVWKREIRCG